MDLNGLRYTGKPTTNNTTDLPNGAAASNRDEKAMILGGFHSFDGDSLEEFDEFDSESVTLTYFQERYIPSITTACRNK